jgi:hypothetical protein
MSSVSIANLDRSEIIEVVYNRFNQGYCGILEKETYLYLSEQDKNLRFRVVLLSDITGVLFKNNKHDECIKILEEIKGKLNTNTRNMRCEIPAEVEQCAETRKESASLFLYNEPTRELPVGRLDMNAKIKTIAMSIPDEAAKIFFFGIIVTIASFVTIFLTESILPRFILVIGLAATAIGLQIGERAIVDSAKK